MSAANHSAEAVKKIVFNPFAPAFRENPYATYALLREHGVQRSLGMWVITRYADLRRLFRDRRFSAELIPSVVRDRLAKLQIACPEAIELGRNSIVFTDNPEHARLRKLANLVFNRDSLDALLGEIKRAIARLTDDLVRASRGDFVQTVARPLPLEVLMRWMGLDVSHLDDVAGWNHEVRYFLEPGVISEPTFRKVQAALNDFMQFFASAIDERKRAPGNDLISELLRARLKNDDGFTEREVIYTCIMVYVAGAETTQALLGNTAYLLATHPDEFEKLLRREVTPAAAVNEILRYESPLQMTKRLCIQDMEFEGVRISAGEQILLCIGAGNRDGTVFDDPDRFQLDRANAAAHLGFGYGMHSCLGAYLAQLQLECFLEEVVARRLRFAIHGAPAWVDHTLLVRGLKSLDVSVHEG